MQHNIFQQLRQYKFSKQISFPRVNIAAVESVLGAYTNNPYLRKALIRPRDYDWNRIILITSESEVWQDKSKIPLIEDKQTIKKIIADSKNYVKQYSKVLKDLNNIDLFKKSNQELIKILDELNKISLHAGYPNSLLNDDCFFIKPRDYKLIEILREARLELGQNIALPLLNCYNKLAEAIARRFRLTKANVDGLTIKELKDLIHTNFKKKQYQKAGKRLTAFVLIKNRIFTIFNDEVKELKTYLEAQNPDVEAILKAQESKVILGQPVYPGKVKGKVIILKAKDYFNSKQILAGKKNYILVTPMTRPEIVTFLKGVSAIITDEGGITCHAAIVAREMKKPCVVGTKISTQVLKTGDLVEVNADTGVIRILS